MDSSIDLHNLDVDMNRVIDMFPDETEKLLRRSASQWKKDCNSKMPKSYYGGKHSIPTSWKNKANFRSYALAEIEISNHAPHFHLVENGHRLFVKGVDTGGFVPGRHYAEKTREEWKDIFPEKTEEFISKLLGGNNL